jgi:hypothetical protein
VTSINNPPLRKNAFPSQKNKLFLQPQHPVLDQPLFVACTFSCSGVDKTEIDLKILKKLNLRKKEKNSLRS